jgi:hypothetical protein
VADGVAAEVFDEAHVAEGAGAVVEEGEFEFEEVFGAGGFEVVAAVALPAVGGAVWAFHGNGYAVVGEVGAGGLAVAVEVEVDRAGLQCHIF